MNHPVPNRAIRHRTAVSLMRELKELLSGCVLIGLAAFLMLRPGQHESYPEAVAMQQSESAETSTTTPNRPSSDTLLPNEIDRNKGTLRNQAPAKRSEDRAERFGPNGNRELVAKAAMGNHPGEASNSLCNITLNCPVLVYRPQTTNTIVLGPGELRNPRGMQSSQRHITPGRTRAQVRFGNGLHKFWSRHYDEALERFQAARRTDPTDAAYLYFSALAYLRSGQADLAKTALAEAVALEASYPIPNWGRMMERVQGRQRVWLEEARTDAAMGWRKHRNGEDYRDHLCSKG